MPLAAARPVGGEEDAVVGAIERTDDVVPRGLIADLADDRRVARAESRDLVDLPVIVLIAVLLRLRADDHAEERLRPAPVHRRLPHRDRRRTLHPAPTKPRRPREILRRTVRV